MENDKYVIPEHLQDFEKILEEYEKRKEQRILLNILHWVFSEKSED